MKPIRVDKKVLIAKLQENREKHRSFFLKAQEGYIQDVTTWLQEKMEEARKGKNPNLRHNFVFPQDHTEDYDRVLGMLSLHEDTHYELEEHDYDQYWLDNWEWSQRDIGNATRYLK